MTKRVKIAIISFIICLATTFLIPKIQHPFWTLILGVIWCVSGFIGLLFTFTKLGE